MSNGNLTGNLFRSCSLSCLLLFAFNEPACDTRTSDERSPSEVKPGENPIPETKVQYEQAPPPSYSEPTPTFQTTQEGGTPDV